MCLGNPRKTGIGRIGFNTMGHFVKFWKWFWRNGSFASGGKVTQIF